MSINAQVVLYIEHIYITYVCLDNKGLKGVR